MTLSFDTIRRLWIAVATWDVLAFLALLGIGTFATLNHDTGYYDRGPSPEQTLVDLWLLWAFLPAVVFTIAAVVAYYVTEEDF